jgi:CRP/FNR family transcriptional regulator, cyclic AMP receptor protein
MNDERRDQQSSSSILKSGAGPIPMESECWKILSTFASAQTYPTATELFKQGSSAEEIYFIHQGLVKLVYLNSNGKEFLVGLRSSGWTLGVSSVLLEKPFPVSAITLTRCSLIRIPAKSFLQALETDYQLTQYILRVQSREFYDQVSTLVGLGCHSARHRFEQLLWQLTSALEQDNLQNAIHVQLPLKHWEIAQLLSVTPQHLSKLIKQMQQEGIIKREKGWLIIPNPQSLYHTDDF